MTAATTRLVAHEDAAFDAIVTVPVSRVLVIHDEQLDALALQILLREALRAQIEIVGPVGVNAAAAAVRRLQPALALLCASPPGAHAPELVRAMLAAWPRLRVVVQCAPSAPQAAVACLGAGAAGVVSTDAAPMAAASALLTVLGGMSVVPSWLLAKLEVGVGWTIGTDLSTEEEQLWRLLTNGASNDEIGHTMHLSDRTVKRRICFLLCKLAVSNRIKAAALGGRAGLLDGEASNVVGAAARVPPP